MGFLSAAPTDPEEQYAQTLAGFERRIADLERSFGRTPTRIGGAWTGAAAQLIGISTLTTINWTAETADSNGFLTPTSGSATIPSALDGVYAITATGLWATAPTGNNFMRIITGGNTYDFSGNTVGQVVSASVEVPLAAAATVVVQVFQTSGAAINIGTTVLYLTRTGP
jgi:hypothetical protein